MSRQERGAMRAKIAARRAAQVVEEATARVVARRRVPPNVEVPLADHEPPAPSSPQDPRGEGRDLAQRAKDLRDKGIAWWVIGQTLGLAGKASSASEPEAKRGAGQARRLYAAANRGEVPRTQRQRAGTVAKPTGPASRGVPAYLRKEALVRDGHVIPRDMSDEEVEAMLVGRRIEWAIDMAKLTDTDPETWGPEERRWVPQEAKVHPDPQWVKVIREEDEERVVYFREYLGQTQDGRRLSGPTRCVRVDAIYTVA